MKRVHYNTKIEGIKKKIPNHDKCITINNFNKFSDTIFDERLKWAKAATNNDLNIVEWRSTRNEKKNYKHLI